MRGLTDALIERGHNAEIIGLPLQWNPPARLVDTALAWRLLDLTSADGVPVDLVICTKYPTWAANHPNKVLWLVHQHRQAYDLHGTQFSEFRPTTEGRRVRQSVVSIDRRGIRECRRRFTISQNVSNRLRSFLGVEASPLYPPVPDRDLWAESYDPFILSASRLDPIKRIDALIAAWPGVDHSLRLKIASDGKDRSRLESIAQHHGVSDRIDFLGRVDDDTLARLYRLCRAVFYAPIDEDYGYSAVEALRAGKPVVTAPDSGGILEFVEDGRTGIVSDLEPTVLASSVNRLADEGVAKALGRNGPAKTSNISWDVVVRSLVGESE